VRPPTDKQKSVLQFIRSYQADNGMPPTLREIAKHMGVVSTNAANDYIRALVKRGLLRRRPLISRGLSLTAEGYLCLQKPIVTRGGL
jgi:repressor LexA